MEHAHSRKYDYMHEVRNQVWKNCFIWLPRPDCWYHNRQHPHSVLALTALLRGVLALEAWSSIHNAWQKISLATIRLTYCYNNTNKTSVFVILQRIKSVGTLDKRPMDLGGFPKRHLFLLSALGWNNWTFVILTFCYINIQCPLALKLIYAQCKASKKESIIYKDLQFQRWEY